MFNLPPVSKILTGTTPTAGSECYRLISKGNKILVFCSLTSRVKYSYTFNINLLSDVTKKAVTDKLDKIDEVINDEFFTFQPKLTNTYKAL